MTAAATKRALAISCVGFALACTPAATTSAPSAPLGGEGALTVPPLADAGAGATRDGIRFGRAPAKVGQRWRVSTRAESRTKDGEQVSAYESDVALEVLEVDGDAPSRVRLRFDRNVNVYESSERPTRLDGRTFVVGSTAPHVRDASGAAAAEEDAERVLDVFPDVGTRARIEEVLPEDAMAIGESRDDLAAAILRTMHPRAWQLERGTAVLARVEAGAALFVVTLVAKTRQGLHMDVKGVARVRLRDARLVDLTLDGSYENGHPTQGIFSMRRVARDD